MKTKNSPMMLIISFLSVFSFCNASDRGGSVKQQDIRKIKDVIIYEDAQYYSSFPSVVKTDEQDFIHKIGLIPRPLGRKSNPFAKQTRLDTSRLASGLFIVAFRRAPERKMFGEKGSNHVDPNSYLVSVRSKDGEIWTKEPELIYAHPFGGSQDPCLLKLQDGTLLCTSYGWAFVRPDGIPNLKTPYFKSGGAIFLGGYLVRSLDNGKTWEGPIYPPHVDAEIYFSALGDPVSAYNRGALCEGKGGRIYWVVANHDSIPQKKTSNHLIVSDDKGLTWHYSGLVATDDKISFNETSIYETPKGDLVAFLRTANFDDQACIARSTDGGKTFKWESMGFQGHPLNALRLPDNRVLLTYGYRHEPYGIRARILNAECTDYATAPEFVLRDDGGNTDIGYSWPVQLDENRVLVVYYFNKDNGTRHIAGTILEIKK